MNKTEQTIEKIIVEIVRIKDSATRGMLLDDNNHEFFKGYAKACEDINRTVIRRLVSIQAGVEKRCAFCGDTYKINTCEKHRPTAVCENCWPIVSEIEVKSASKNA